MSKLRLTGSQKLQVVLSGAATASRVTVSYMDFTTTAVAGGTQLSVTNGATPVDVCDAPAASTTRQVDHIKLVAKAAMTATFNVYSGSALEWDTITLASGDVFEWGGNGAFVKDSGGNIKRVIGGAVAATTIAASGLITANAGATIASGQTLTLTGATVAGTPTWSSSQAITLSTAAQPNVTSVGTLTSLASGVGTFTKATAGDSVVFTNGGASNKTGYLFTDNSLVGMFNVASAGGGSSGVYLTATQAILSASGGAVVTASSGSVAVTGTLGVTQSVSMTEMTAPAGVANTAKLFAVDNGAGKTVLKVIFGSGAAQVISTEP